MEDVQLFPKKSFQIDLVSDKNNSYSVKFNLSNYIEIIVNQINDIFNKLFTNKYSFEEIRENKYFLQFDTLNEIFDEIKERILNNKIIIKENENNNLYISIPLPSSKNKEMIFEFKPIIKNNNEKNNELSELLTRLNKEINKNNEEISNLKSQTEQLNCENKQLTKEINDMKNKETQLINENAQIISDNNLLKNEVNQLKEKLNILWKERSKLTLSKIINGNTKYSDRIKNWINSSSEIETELLYRLSENGDSKSLFHELCDNKGPTLTLFHVNDGNIVGIYTPLSWDSSSNWKKDMDTFIFI